MARCKVCGKHNYGITGDTSGSWICKECSLTMCSTTSTWRELMENESNDY